jgi:hypothetical protein
MNSTLRKDELPEGGFWKTGRQYIFKVNKDSVECEDFAISASLLCRGYRYAAGKIDREYEPGKFAGMLLGIERASGRNVYVALIQGNPQELFERKNLFHCGAHLVDPADFSAQRQVLMAALANAKQISKMNEKAGGNE